MLRLADQVVIISGGASGLGRAVVDRFVAEGAVVAVVDKSADGLAAVQAAHGDQVLPLQADVRSMSQMRDAVSDTVSAFKKLDCVIGNAGLWDYSVKLDDIAAESLTDAYDELFQVNVLGYLTLAKAAIGDLVRSRGSLIFTVSNAGYHPNGGGVLYTASKHAVVGIIRQLAFELAPSVRVNGVAPGPINSRLRGPVALGMGERTIDQLDLPTNVAGQLAINRVPEVTEYAGAYVYLACREDSAASTGDVVNADCGIGIRGMSKPAIGRGLAEKYDI